MPKIIAHDQYRKELLFKSFELFAHKGYAITMRQLAQGLGVSTGTLYHYFPNKEALFVQLIAEQTQHDILNFLAEAGHPPTLSERIETLFDFIAKNEDYFIKQTLLYVDFYQQHDLTEDLNTLALKQADQQTIQAIADYLQISDIDNSVIADFVLSTFYGLLVRRMLGEKTISYQEQGALLGKMLTVYLEQ